MVSVCELLGFLPSVVHIVPLPTVFFRDLISPYVLFKMVGVLFDRFIYFDGRKFERRFCLTDLSPRMGGSLGG